MAKRALPLHANQEEFLINIPSHQKTFITQTKSADESYTTVSFGNWFGKQCKEAGVPGRARGLRKSGATKLAEAGGTEFEIMTFLGHSNPGEARKYVKKADKKLVADNAMARQNDVQPLPSRHTKSPRNSLSYGGFLIRLVRPTGLEPVLPP